MSRNQRSTNRLPLARKLEYHDRGSHYEDDGWECSVCTYFNEKSNHNYHPEKCSMCARFRCNSHGGGGDGDSDDDDDQTPVDRDCDHDDGDVHGKDEEEQQPEVVKGGDNDFFTVNHVASIQVNNNNSNNNNNNSNVDMSNENDNASSSSQPTKQPHKTKRIPNGILKKPANSDTGGRRKKNGCDDGSEDSASGTGSDVEVFDPDNEIEELNDITTSPYLKGRSAEKNEEPFVRLKRLLHLPESSREAVEAFNTTDAAWATIKSYQLIEKSGMVYSQHWREGLIHGENFGKIPSNILVLILQPMRFVKASETDLGAIVKELEVPAMIQLVVEEWGLEDEYPLVVSTDKIFHFSRRKRDCYRCALFLARLASCCKTFKIPLVGTSKKKAIKCLDILEDHIIDVGVKSANLGTQVDSGEQQEETTAKDNSSAAKPPPNATSNKSEGRVTKKKTKRGRPIERSLSPNLSVQSDASSLLFDDGNEGSTDEPEIVGPPPKKKRGRPAGSKNINIKKNGRTSSSANKIAEAKSSTNATTTNGNGKGRRSSNKSSSALSLPSSSNSSNTGHTLQQLIGRFEQQYHEMGELLEQIKTVATNSRSPTEQQIRDEVLEEVKSSLLGSLPKK